MGTSARDADYVLIRLWETRVTYGDAAPRPMEMVKRLRKEKNTQGMDERQEQ